jgi:uncharacterized repeat protein (TIGR03803 family)
MWLRAAGAALMLVVVLGLGAVTTQSAQAQTFTTLWTSHGQPDGQYPYARLVRDTAGNLYGTTYGGGSSNLGAVFEVNPSGNETVLYSFVGGVYRDGQYPYAGVIRDAAGNLYGTTYGGGSYGLGAVYKLSSSGTETVLYNFSGDGADGAYPYGGLIMDAEGNLYGTTEYGGGLDKGTVFKLSTSGEETVLHSFGAQWVAARVAGDGAYPFGGLIIDAEGNLYGTTNQGGAYNVGTVFEVSKAGKETVLHNFVGDLKDGCYPMGDLLRDKAGNLYGTTNSCGPIDPYGTVYKLSPSGEETILHNFLGQNSGDGAYPVSGVIMDAKGNLYGDTYSGGAYGLGTVYELDKKGTLTVLHSFLGETQNGGEGAYPMGGLIMDATGNLYGTTNEGGYCFNFGTVWEWSPLSRGEKGSSSVALNRTAESGRSPMCFDAQER